MGKTGKTRKNNDERIFFGRWLRDPLRMGTFLPSGANLARAVAAAATAGRDGVVVELGGGTGAVTKALLAAGVAPENLIVIERDPNLYGVLVERFPDAKVILGDALEVKALTEGAGPIAAVVSGIPLLNMPPSFQKKLLAACFEILAEDGVFVQFTYGPASPVPERRLRQLGLVPRLAGRVWRNVPPATVWCFQRRGKGAEERARAPAGEQARAAGA